MSAHRGGDEDRGADAHRGGDEDRGADEDQERGRDPFGEPEGPDEPGRAPPDGPRQGAAGEPGDSGEPLPNLAVRIVELVVSPGRLFDRLRERPAWIAAVVLMVVVSAAATWLMPEEILREAATANMPADATPEQMEDAARFARVGGYVGSVLGPPVAVLFVAGALMFVYNVVLGGEAGYVQLLAVTSHAMLIPTLGSLLVLPLMISTGEPSTRLALHLVVPGLEEGFFYRFLHGMNLFGLWAATLLGLAVSRIYPRRTFGTSAAVVLTLYATLKLAGAILGGLAGGA